MEIKRDVYLNKLILGMHNKMIKVVQVLEDVENHIYYLICFTII